MNYEKAIEEIIMILQSNADDVVQKVIDYLQGHFETYSWIGIYLLKNNKLLLGPWNGPQATEHTEIPLGQGVCGSAAKSGKIENVADVQADDRYLSCFISTRSELVVPIFSLGKVIGEIDIDSDSPNAFTKEDEKFLKRIADMLAQHIHIS